MKRLPIHHSLILIIAAHTLLSAVVLFGIIGPTLAYVARIRTTVATTATLLETYEQKMRERDYSSRPSSDMGEVIEKFKNAALAPLGELPLIARFETLAEENNIALDLDARFVGRQDAASADDASPGLSPYYEFSFVNTGAFRDHIAFFNALEKLPEYVIIQSMALDKQNGNAEPALVVARFRAVVFAKEHL